LTEIGWLNLYLVFGLLNGELAIVATRQKGSRLRGRAYVVLVLLWPGLLLLGLVAVIKKGK
jgi:hypothetical protein